MKLYNYFRSSASWRVRTGLGFKGLPVDYIALHLLRDGGDQHTAEHRRRNPIAQIPVLELDDGRHIAQSLAILEYLEETHPTPPLLPRDPWLRARSRMLAEIVNSGIQPLQNTSTLQALTALGQDSIAWSRSWIDRGLRALDEAAAPTAGRFLVGDAVSFADISLVPQLYNARRFGVDVAPFGRLLAVEAACLELPAFQAAHPDRQPDAEPPAP